MTVDDNTILVHGEEDVVLASARMPEGELIAHLREAGLWSAATQKGRRRERAYWEGMGLEPRPLATKLFVVGDLKAVEVGERFVRAGMEVGEDGGLAVVITDDYLRPAIAEILRTESRVLLMKPVGMELWLGPFLEEDGEATYQQLAYWLRGKRADRARILGWNYPAAVGVAATEWSWSYAMGWLGVALAMIEAGEGAEWNELKSVDLRCPHTEKHWIRRSALSAPQQWVSRHTGIVRRMKAGLQSLGQWHAQAEYQLPALRGQMHRQRTFGYAYGSGISDAEARDKAVYEAVERFCSHVDGEEQFQVMTYNPETCIHPNELMLFSEEQYAGREAWNVGRPDVEQVPERFREDQPIAWMRAKAMGDYPDLWAPAGVVLMDHADDSQAWFAVSESTGCAAGPTLAAAIEAGRRELIERDAVSMWWYRRAIRPGWAWRELGCERSVQIGNSIEQEGWHLELLNLSTDMGVAVFAAIASRPDGSEPVFAAGAAERIGVAALRAIQELSQVLTWRRVLDDRDVYGLAEVEAFQRGHEDCAETLKDRTNFREYYVDLTRSRVGIPVARVMIPGLLPNGYRRGGARLQEAPSRFGWQCGVSDSKRGPATPCPL